VTDFYLRDASFWPMSRAGGSMPKYHAKADHDAVSACSAGKRLIMLITESPVDATDLQPSEVCSRPACRRAYDNSLSIAGTDRKRLGK
jgi:hypothetical protein